ncbi:hypothetical protein FTW19_03330 [Terriglobus albidus]|uniref:Uncharacterized protein n=1 Tax=Terriglobus albidus TaxID=1592106 RepID=A0A5B9E954_9BACT|nr:hypothetical protein [Terriglobus albidus]QEE27130.1 hypothetical protein FTW19_03330 [Terriglobus albidus]
MIEARTRRFKVRRILYVSLAVPLAVILLTAAFWHLQIFLFQHRARVVLQQFKQVTPGVTSGAQALALLPRMRPLERPEDYRQWCAPDATCYSSVEPEDSAFLKGLVWLIDKTRSGRFVGPTLSTLGWRDFYLTENLAIRNGTVAIWNVDLHIDDGNKGVAAVDFVSLPRIRSDGFFSSLQEQDDGFWSRPKFTNWGDTWLVVLMTPQIEPQLRDALLQPGFSCANAFHFCPNGAKDLLPILAARQSTTREAAKKRLLSSDPCPETIVRNHVRDAEWIIAGRIDAITGDTPYIESVQMSEMRTLKGNPHLQKDALLADASSWLTEPTGRMLLDQKPFLRSGKEILFISDGMSQIDDSCHTLEATPENVALITSLAAKTVQRP